MFTRFTSIAALAAVTVTGLSAPAFAGTTVPTRIVRTADLNLSTDQGVAALQSRIKRATYAVCGPVDARDLAAVAQHARCRTESLARASGDVERVVMNARSGERSAMAGSSGVTVSR